MLFLPTTRHLLQKLGCCKDHENIILATTRYRCQSHTLSGDSNNLIPYIQLWLPNNSLGIYRFWNNNGCSKANICIQGQGQTCFGDGLLNSHACSCGCPVTAQWLLRRHRMFYTIMLYLIRWWGGGTHKVQGHKQGSNMVKCWWCNFTFLFSFPFY